MAVDAFIPEVWNANLLTALEKSLILADPGFAVNTDYEGDIAEAGDTVHIGTLVDPTIKTYVKNSTVIVPDVLTITDQTLVIDQSKYYAIGIDDIDKRQALGGGTYLSKAAVRAAYQLREVVDTFVGTKMVAGAGTTIPATTLPAGNADAVYALLLKIKTKFDKMNIPSDQRWVAGDPEVLNQIFWDKRFTDVSAYGGAGASVANGEIGRALGMRIKTSTNMPAGATAAADGNSASSWLLAGAGNTATSYAQQLSKTEAYRPESSFSDAVKGLALYGAKVVRPEFLIKADVLVDNTP